LPGPSFFAFSLCFCVSDPPCIFATFQVIFPRHCSAWVAQRTSQSPHSIRIGHIYKILFAGSKGHS
jgi:hypothetical protein